MKPYYDCPIKAVFMAEYHGMRFVSWHSGKEYDITVIQSNIGSPIEAIRKSQKYVIHPDSLYLLEPQTGDLIDDDGLFGVMEDNGEVKVQGDAVAVSVTLYRAPRIIQRKGLAFHWPETEAE